jgi:hypothetical protein
MGASMMRSCLVRSTHGCTSNAFTVFAVMILGANGRTEGDPTFRAWIGLPTLARPAVSKIVTCWIGALAGTPVANVSRTRVVVIAVDGVSTAIAIIANVVRACDPVVAVRVSRAFRFSADALNTNAAFAIPVAGVTFG